MSPVGLTAGDISQLEAWALELETEFMQGSKPAASRAALLRRVLAAAGARAADSSAAAQAVAAAWRPPEWDLEAKAASGSCRNLIGDQAQEEIGKRFLFVSDSAMYVNDRHVLSTHLGEWLTKVGAMRSLLVGLSVVLLIISILDPLSELVPQDGPLRLPQPDGQIAVLRLKREGIFVWLSEDLGFTLFWFLMLHYVNRELAAKALFTYDAGIILGSFVVSELAMFYNKLYVWRPLGYYDDHWLMFDLLHVLIVVAPVALTMCTLDSWKVTTAAKGLSSRLKILLSALVICYFMKSCYSNSVGPGKMYWEDRKVCYGPFCATPRKLFLQAEFQKVIFLSSAVVRYALGCPFAFIRPTYKGRGIIGEVAPQKSAAQHQDASYSSDGSEGESSSGSPSVD